ncbi:hypothetical protein MRX96_016796 [Rhipicephalus microplus]
MQVANRINVNKIDKQLVTWSKEGLDVLEKMSVPVKFKDRESQLPLLILKNDGNTPLGGNRWAGSARSTSGGKRLVDNTSIGTIYGIDANLDMDDNVTNLVSAVPVVSCVR